MKKEKYVNGVGGAPKGKRRLGRRRCKLWSKQPMVIRYINKGTGDGPSQLLGDKII
jgi:hypothetical protein